MYSEYTQSALEILRHPSLTMHWYTVPIFLVLFYILGREMHDKHYHVLAGGVALWGMDLFNEIWNSMVCFISGYAPVWGTPMGVGDTSFLILIGYNIEISMMFLMMGISTCLMLPEDRKAKILGINNRVFYCIVFTTMAVLVECFLNFAGILTWEWPFWQRKVPWLLWLIGYLPFFATAFYVHDRPTLKSAIKCDAAILGFDAILLVVCGFAGWL